MGAGEVPCCEPMFWGYMFACVVLVCFAGLMSGLTLGLMSLSLVELEVIAKAGQPQDRKNAEKILPIVKNHHLLLCTLLISNAMAMEALPIFVDSLLPAWASVLISVTLILVFGEIIPQAVCSRYGLSVGAKLSFLVRLLVLVFFPLSYPISKLLDWLLGKGHAVLLRRPELKTLVDIHGAKAGKGGELTLDETTIISGALDMTQKTAKDAMTPVSEIFSLDIESKLDEPTMGQILSKGHSRVPIYCGSPTNIVGIVLVKSLIKLRPKDETPIKDLAITRIPRVHESLPLYDLLNEFQKGHSHMAAVVKEERETTEKEAKPSVIKLNTGVDSRQTHAVRKGTNQLRSQSKRQNLSAKSSSMDFSETEIQISSLNNVKLNHNLSSQPKKKWEQEGKIISLEDLESLSNLNGEVTGIITLEDVMEELLQEEILDETDEFVIHHKRIKINMSPSRISPTTWNSHMQWQTSMASPASSYEHTPSSSYNHTPIMNSPISTYGQSPPIRPPLCPSPSPSPNYPPIYAGGGR